MNNVKNYIKFILFIIAAVVGGNLGFDTVRIVLLAILAIVAVEVVYKVDKYFTQLRKSRE